MSHEPGPRSPSIEYRRVSAADADELHALIVDEYVKRYLCDGETLPRAWADETIAAAEALYRGRGVGLWLLHEPGAARPFGLCGFVVVPGFAAFGGEPQLVYALREAATGRGLATEAATACVEFARARAGMTAIVAAVDAPNVASIRVLERLGFARCGEVPGAFGSMVLFRLAAGG
jgi:RimJ/RimL family protein N-acetyltransferase